MTRAADQNKRVYVVRWYRLLVGGYMVFVSVASLVMAAQAVAADRQNLLLAPFVLAMFVLALRAVRSATVEVSDVEVSVRGQFRTRRVALDEVVSVGVAAGSTMMLAWRVPYIELRDGSVIRMDEIRSQAEPSIVDDVIADIHGRINGDHSP